VPQVLLKPFVGHGHPRPRSPVRDARDYPRTTCGDTGVGKTRVPEERHLVAREVREQEARVAPAAALSAKPHGERFPIEAHLYALRKYPVERRTSLPSSLHMARTLVSGGNCIRATWPALARESRGDDRSWPSASALGSRGEEAKSLRDGQHSRNRCQGTTPHIIAGKHRKPWSCVRMKPTAQAVGFIRA
jgi:hypothetical protein